MVLDDLFIDVNNFPQNGYGLFQLTYLVVGYGLVLMYGANLISDGAELLLLVPSWAGIIGSIVLPVLGAVPDGAIVLFSGLGPDAQKQLDVGVGTLAGSSIMLLTIPWFLSVFAGRVSILNNRLNYDTSPRLLDHNFIDSLTKTGVHLGSYVNKGGLIMILTSFLFLFLQIPGVLYYDKDPNKVAKSEKLFAGIGFVASITFFFAYLLYQRHLSQQTDSVQNAMRLDLVTRSIHKGDVSLLGALVDEFRKYDQRIATNTTATPMTDKTRLLQDQGEESLHDLRIILRPFFMKYDHNGNDSLDIDLGETSSVRVNEQFRKFDRDNNGFIDFDEFVEGMGDYIATTMRENGTGTGTDGNQLQDTTDTHHRLASSLSRTVSVAVEEEDEEEVPEDLRHLTPDQQQSRIKTRAAWKMFLGTFLILFFSDPMVGVLDSLGRRLGIGSFYIAFVVAPLVSNGAEVVAAYTFASKKTKKSITISLTTLEGAACMNNTFCLSIFMLLVYLRGLSWEYSAETLVMLLAQLFVGVMAMRRTQTLLDACLVLSVYPLSVLLVAGLEAVGWD
eukprot:gene8387-17293_t